MWAAAESKPEEEFDHRQGYLRGVRLSNGGLAVIDVSRVHYFDARGNRMRIVGRKGQGPEEFLYLTAICRTRGDTIVVGDGHNRRLTVIDPNGRIVRTVAQGDHGYPHAGSFCFNDGSFVLMRSVGEVVANSRRQRITKIRVDGSVERVIGEFVGRSVDMVSMTGVSIATNGGTLLYADPFAGEVRAYTSAGRLFRIFRLTEPRQRMTDAEIDERLAMTVPSNVLGTERTQRMARLKALPHSETWPLFFNFHVSPEGAIWLHDFQRDFRSANVWTGFDSTGRVIGRLQLPELPARTFRPEVHGFGSDHVMLRRFDADMATFLSIYPLVRVENRR